MSGCWFVNNMTITVRGRGKDVGPSLPSGEGPIGWGLRALCRARAPVGRRAKGAQSDISQSTYSGLGYNGLTFTLLELSLW